MPERSVLDIVRDRLADDSPGGFRVGAPTTAGGLTLFPLFHNGGAIEYEVLAGAQQAGTVAITEVGSGGSVPTLSAKNSAQLPVLMVEGEILIGLKQNRVLNTSILVPPATTLEIPVACVEARRWHRSSAKAARAKYSLSAMLRAKISPGVIRHARLAGTFHADQRAVWDGVAERISSHKVRSKTMAYSDIENARGLEIEDVVREFAPAPDQTGVLAFVGTEPLSLDIFDQPSTLVGLWRELVGGYAEEALLGQPHEAIDAQKASAWIRSLSDGEGSSHPGVGLGETVFITAQRHNLSALVVNGIPVHIAAWPA
jgi:hypothetical protein